jgi:hypothetical protein
MRGRFSVALRSGVVVVVLAGAFMASPPARADDPANNTSDGVFVFLNQAEGEVQSDVVFLYTITKLGNSVLPNSNGLLRSAVDAATPEDEREAMDAPNQLLYSLFGNAPPPPG